MKFESNQWSRIRDSDGFEELIAKLVTDWFSRHGEDNVAKILMDAGLTKEVVVNLTTRVGAPFVAQAMDHGFLEERIRAHLRPFYESDEAAEILATD